MKARADPSDSIALMLRVHGLVQGVGFRPFVHRLATRHHLSGWARNESGDVCIAVQGSEHAVNTFVEALLAEAPVLARIDDIETVAVTPDQVDGFRVLASSTQPDRRQPVAPDVAMCSSCETELLDPSNRRYRYPFITCTDCGPRFTVIESLPYDRERTSMRVFRQCTSCWREFTSPEDRRYHSQTNSCHVCGPRWVLETSAYHAVAEGDAALSQAAELLRGGMIVAIRGLGGFHLAADATNDGAVRRLRWRKQREAKPLAIMVRSVGEAQRIAHVSDVERQLLQARERPIVLLEPVPEAGLAPSLAPGLSTVGVMTPYTPLHQLLLEAVQRPLVMTSGNVSDEPIAIDNDDARARLDRIADAFLLHNRDIVSRYDDSVVRIVNDAPLFLRRARGYAPLPLALPIPTPRPLVAVGPHLKNTFTLAHGKNAYVSQHIGDLESLETLEHFQQTLTRYRTLFSINPEIAVRDLHPGYLSTRIADEFGCDLVIPVQHHHAHVAAVMAEHAVTDRVIGVAFDGTGFGSDGHVWGAEVMVADLVQYERVGQLRYAPLPGGDLAARNPWRAALGFLSLASDLERHFAIAFANVTGPERQMAERQISRRLNAPLASSMGRLFDAAAAVLGVRTVAQYEGQAAMELESLAGARPAEPLPFPVHATKGKAWMLDPIPLLSALGERRLKGGDVRDLAARFHESVAQSTCRLVGGVADTFGITTVALGGGVFQNRRLLESVERLLQDAGLTVLIPRRLSPNDGAISYGQVAVAAAKLRGEGGA